MDWNIKTTYSFDVYPVAILGTNFQEATLMAILDQQTANAYIDTQSMHIQVYPTLPVGTPNDPSAYNYLKFKLPSGETTVIGEPWINSTSIQVVSLQTMTIQISVRTPADQQLALNCLAANGLTVISSTVS